MRVSPFSIQRRVVATKTSEAWRTVPHVAFVHEPDATQLLACFREHRQVGDVRVSLNTLLLRVITEGLKAAPRLNAHVEFERRTATGSLRPLDEINIALAWDKDGVMITPTVFGCERLDLSGLQRAVEETRERVDRTDVDELLFQAVKTATVDRLRHLDLRYVPAAVAGSLPFRPRPGLHGARRRRYYDEAAETHLAPRDLLGATVSVSNVGSLMPGVRGHFAMLQIIAPQVFVVGLNPPHQELRGGETRDILPFTLVFDHRALDFTDLVPFIRRVDQLLEEMTEVRDWFGVG